MHVWDPDRYLLYGDERGRPFMELIARIGAEDPHLVVDLGCGPGNLTRPLAERWPHAQLAGWDSSPEMVAAARAAGVEATVGDLREWASSDSGELVDVLVSNATLQWLPEHLDLLPALLSRVAPGGWFAFQVPGNFDQPSHTIRTELAAQEPYAGYTESVAVPASHEPDAYLRRLQEIGCAVDVWETTYLHVLTGPDPVFTWVSGTGARPTLQALPPALRSRFEGEFKARLAIAYPDDGNGVLLPFRRIFAVAQVPG